jgi:FkbM family methyltransferase
MSSGLVPPIFEVLVVHDYADAATEPGAMVDVGAHSGQSCRAFLDAGWRVFAFEPDPANRAKLDRLAETFPDLVVDPRAVSDEARSDVPFYTSPTSTGISSLQRFDDEHVVSTTVETVPLRDWMQSREVPRIDLLKTDTEGFDLPVLRGFPWEDARPRFVVCEFEDSKTRPLGYVFDDLARFLVNRSYHVLLSEWDPIREYGMSHTWRRLVPYPCELADAASWGNLIAFADEPDWPRLANSVAGALARFAAEKQGAVERRDRAIAGLRAKLDSVTSSRSWRLTRPLRALAEWVCRSRGSED